MIEKIREIMRNIRDKITFFQGRIGRNSEKKKIVKNNKPKKIKKIIKVSLLAILGMILLLIVFLGVFFVRSLELSREWIDKIDKGEIPESIREMIANRETEAGGDIWAKYKLKKGWNFVAFPIKPIGFDRASGLMRHVGKKGGYVTTVAMWDGDRWIEFVQRAEMQFGDDFLIEPGKAYFLDNQREILWKVAGEPVKVSKYELQKGWNALGVVKKGMKANDVLSGINKDGKKTEMMGWININNIWELYINKTDSEGKTEEVGKNSLIQKTSGYMINLKEAVVWRPE